MQALKLSVTVILALALVACVSTSHVLLTNKTWPPILDPMQVQVFMSEQEVKKPFEKIAIINAKGGHALERTKFIKAIKEKAAKLGANGVILGQFKEATTGDKWRGALFGGAANDEDEAIAIHLKQ